MWLAAEASITEAMLAPQGFGLPEVPSAPLWLSGTA